MPLLLSLLLAGCSGTGSAPTEAPPPAEPPGPTITFTVPEEVAQKLRAAEAEADVSRYVAPPAPANPDLLAAHRQITAEPPDPAALAAGRAAAEDWLIDYPRDAEALFLVGHSFVREQKFAEALPTLEQTVALAPSNLPARKDYAGALLSVDRCPDSLPHLDLLMQAGFTEKGEVPFMRSFCRKAAGDLPGALADAEAACAEEYPKSCRISRWLQGRIEAAAAEAAGGGASPDAAGSPPPAAP